MQKQLILIILFFSFSALQIHSYDTKKILNDHKKAVDLALRSRMAKITKAAFALTATYTIDNQWPSGYQITVTLENNSSTPTNSWQATFSLPTNNKITDFWNGVATTNGSMVTVTNPQWTGGNVIPANSSTTFGMIISRPLNSTTAGINSLIASANGSVVVPAPAAPALNAIVADTNTPNDYTVSWNSVANATAYTLQQDVTSSFANAVTVEQGTALSQSFTNQANGTYYYRVSASNASGTSPYSNTQQITIDVAPIILSAPVAQTISNSTGASQFQLSWSAVTNAQSYTVQQSQTADFASSTNIVSGTTTSAQISVTAIGTYYYRVIAVAGNSMSNPSNVVSTTVTQLPPAPKVFIEGYWESWTSTDPVSAIVNMHVNIIDIAFANFKTTGSHTYQIAGVESDPTMQSQLISSAHALNKKVKISVGGATYPLAPQLKTTQDAVGMAQAVAQYIQANNLDGVDYDIEDSPTAALQVALLQNTRQLLPNALISYTAKSPASSTQPYKTVIQQAYQYVDYISIMAYDYAPGYTYQADVKALLAMGIPASKIVVGLMPGLDDLGVMTSVANITTAAQFVEQDNLAGIMFWDLNTDYENSTGLGQDAATNAAWAVFNS